MARINNNELLKEILPLPSEKVIVDRFSSTNTSEPSSCDGSCGSGACRGFVIYD